MALDLHIGATEEDAVRANPHAAFDEVLHRQLFDRGLLRGEECPLLRRMSSYFADAAYSSDEAGRLASEAESLLGRVNPMLASQLRLVADVAKQASNNRLSLYAFSD